MSFINKSMFAKPPFWKVAGENGNLFILGSLHSLPPKCKWAGPIISKPLRNAETFVGEVADYDDLADYFLEEEKPGGRCFSKTPLKDLLESDQYKIFAGFMEEAGIPGEVWEFYQPWFAVNTLTRIFCQRGGFFPEAGAENLLDPIIKKMNKSTFGLESPTDQFNIFDTLSMATQILLLKNALTLGAGFIGAYEEMFLGWAKGDLKPIDDFNLKVAVETPEFYEALFPKRNPSWVRQLVGFLQIPGDFFVVVGAGHLGGPGGILALLEKTGLTITRIQ